MFVSEFNVILSEEEKKGEAPYNDRKGVEGDLLLKIMTRSLRS